MNKQRRKEIARAVAMIEEAKDILETCLGDETDYFDTMPEAFQDSQRGEDAQSAIAVLEEAVSQVEEASQVLGDLVA